MTNWYPCLLELNGRKTLVVGGGKVAEKKVQGLLDAGAVVTIVSPELTSFLCDLYESNKIFWLRRGFMPEDMDNIWLVIAATDMPEVQENISRLAEAKKIFCNRVDKKSQCSFIVPSVIRQSGLCIAVSTLGKSPAFCRRLKKEIENIIPEDSRYLDIMNELRQHIKSTYQGAEKEEKIRAASDMEIEQLIADCKWDRLEAWALEHLDIASKDIIIKYRDK